MGINPLKSSIHDYCMSLATDTEVSTSFVSCNAQPTSNTTPRAGGYAFSEADFGTPPDHDMVLDFEEPNLRMDELVPSPDTSKSFRQYAGCPFTEADFGTPPCIDEEFVFEDPPSEFDELDPGPVSSLADTFNLISSQISLRK